MVLVFLFCGWGCLLGVCYVGFGGQLLLFIRLLNVLVIVMVEWGQLCCIYQRYRLSSVLMKQCMVIFLCSLLVLQRFCLWQCLCIWMSRMFFRWVRIIFCEGLLRNVVVSVVCCLVVLNSQDDMLRMMCWWLKILQIWVCGVLIFLQLVIRRFFLL